METNGDKKKCSKINAATTLPSDYEDPRNTQDRGTRSWASREAAEETVGTRDQRGNEDIGDFIEIPMETRRNDPISRRRASTAVRRAVARRNGVRERQR
jgi:hypothetical protein